MIRGNKRCARAAKYRDLELMVACHNYLEERSTGIAFLRMRLIKAESPILDKKRPKEKHVQTPKLQTVAPSPYMRTLCVLAKAGPFCPSQTVVAEVIGNWRNSIACQQPADLSTPKHCFAYPFGDQAKWRLPQTFPMN